MADTAAHLAILARRNEVLRFTIAVVGLDMTNVAMNMQVRLARGTPGAPLIQLSTVNTLSAEGLKFDSVTVTNGITTSVIRGRINQSTMSDATKVPYAGEQGADTILAYAMQWTLNGDANTRLEGDFIVRDTAYGSDNAPTSRPASYRTGQVCGGGSSGSLTFGDQVINVTINGIDLLSAEIGKAAVSAASAANSDASAKSAADRAVQAVANLSAVITLGRPSITAAGLDASAGTFVFLATPSKAGALAKFRGRGGSVGGQLRVILATLNGSTGTLVPGAVQTVTLPANAPIELAINIPNTTTQYIVFQAAVSGVFTYLNATPADNAGWASGSYVPGATTFTVGAAQTSQQLQLGVDISYPAFSGQDFVSLSSAVAADSTRIAANEAALSETVIDRIGVLGDPLGTAKATANSIWMFTTPAPRSGPLSLDIHSLAAGTIEVATFAKSGNTGTKVSSKNVDVLVGLNRLSEAKLGINIVAGQFTAVTTGAEGTLSYNSTPAPAGAAWAYGSTPGTTFTDNAQPRTNLTLQMGFNVSGRRLIPVAQRLASLGTARTGYFSHQLNFVNNYGESLSEGSKDPAVTTVKEYDNSGFAAHANGPGSLLDATVANLQLNSRGEFPALGAMGHLKALIAAENGVNFTDGEYQLVTCNNGWSGYKIADLAKGTAPYTLFLSQLDSLASIATSRAKTKAMQATALVLGHNDIAAATGYATFYAGVKQLAMDMAADARLKLAQTFDPIMIVTQTNSASGIAGRGAIAKAILDAANDHALIYLACPLYPFDYYDATHIDSISSKRVGGYAGLVQKRVIVDKGDWQPLQPVRHGVVGNAVDLFFSKDGLTFDTTIMPAQTDMGFSVVDASGTTVAIAGTAIVGTNRIRFTFATAPQPGWRIRYGYNLVTGKANFVGGGGNLRDSAGDRLTYQGWAMHNWCCLFEYLV